MVAVAGTGWRLATSLVRLLVELDQLWPDRDDSHDGTIGDAAHRTRKSDHNPNDRGAVCALDITEDDENGPPLAAFWDLLIARRDGRLKYAIYEGRIVRSYDVAGKGPDGTYRVLLAWRPERYSGPVPHENHLHLSAWDDDDQAGWNLEDIDDMTALTYDQTVEAAEAGATNALNRAAVFGTLTGAETIRNTAQGVQHLTTAIAEALALLKAKPADVDLDDDDVAAISAELAKAFPPDVVDAILTTAGQRISQRAA